MSSNITSLSGGLRTKGIIKKSLSNTPLVTIITVTLNSDKYLEQTIQSVLNQTYDNVEFIIIDGGSKDNSLDLIRKYENNIDFWISEPDKGISDAFNKGIKQAQGDYINFQGAGDYLFSENVIEELMKDINKENDLLICGKVKNLSTDTSEELRILPKNFRNKFNKKTLLFRMSLPHQGLFTNKLFFEKYGLFDEKYIFSMDYEILLRAYKEFPNVVMKDIIVAVWKTGGIGANRTKEILAEYYKIKVKNKVAPNSVLKFINYYSLIKYFFKKYILSGKS